MSGARSLKTLYSTQLKGEAYTPTRSPEAKPFWEACREGVLRLPRCSACSRFHFYPRRFCPFCDSTDIAWVEASGKGTVYTYAIVRQPIEAAYAALVPYCIAVVELAESVRMLTRIDGDVDAVACGKAVRVKFEALSTTLTIPIFELDGEGGSHA